LEKNSILTDFIIKQMIFLTKKQKLLV